MLSGQNLAIGYNNWSTVISAWFDEIEFFKYNSSSNVFGKIGHFTQVEFHQVSGALQISQVYCVTKDSHPTRSLGQRRQR